MRLPRPYSRRRLVERRAGRLRADTVMVLAVQVLIAAGCDAPLHVEPSDLRLAEAGEYGPFLERMPDTAARYGRPWRVVRPSSVSGFDPEPALRRRTSNARGDRALQLWLFGARPTRSAAFQYPCPSSDEVWIRVWVFGGSQTRQTGRVAMRSARRQFVLELPHGRPELLLYEFPLGPLACEGAVLQIEIADARTDPGSVMSAPTLLEPTGSVATTVILVSLDTLRRDTWDESSSRPPSLKALWLDSLRYPRAFTSFPTTPEAHSVLFSGRFFEEAARHPLDERLSFVSALRQAGYTTLAFVAGGYVRAGFGFGARPPGFALGFDVYIEGMQLVDERRAQRVAKEPGAEARFETRTLGPSLERSLRWLSDHPTEPSFHFVHGYDVHEYRTADRMYWEAALDARSAGEREEIDACAERLGVRLEEDRVVHHAFSVFGAFRRSQLGALEECHRRVATLMYEARARSTEDALGRYLDGLRALDIYDGALIIVTSDHGEALLDEAPPEAERPWWGHGRSLATNLEVPLWIKLPGQSGRGRTIERTVGLVDLAATVGDALALNLDPGAGTSALPHVSSRRLPIFFSSPHNEPGVVLEGGALCRFSLEPVSVSVFAEHGWRNAAVAERARCLAGLERLARSPDPPQRPEPPPELRDELRALGYAE